MTVKDELTELFGKYASVARSGIMAFVCEPLPAWAPVDTIVHVRLIHHSQPDYTMPHNRQRQHGRVVALVAQAPHPVWPRSGELVRVVRPVDMRALMIAICLGPRAVFARLLSDSIGCLFGLRDELQTTRAAALAGSKR